MNFDLNTMKIYQKIEDQHRELAEYEQTVKKKGKKKLKRGKKNKKNKNTQE